MIVISGANGRLGSQIVDRLLQHVPADTVGVSVRDVGKAASLAARGVRVRYGDFTRPETLADAFRDATQALVISASIRGDAAVSANIAAIDAARAAGAERVLYTSHQAASPDSQFAPQRVHAAIEAHLREQPLPFIALRNGFYANTLALYTSAALKTGVLAAPQDGPVSWTAHADLADVAVAALTRDGPPDGISPALTAREILDFDAVTAQLSEITGRSITRVVQSDDDWKADAVGRGMPALAADFALGMFRAARNGEFAVTDPTLEEILGHPATPIRVELERNVARG